MSVAAGINSPIHDSAPMPHTHSYGPRGCTPAAVQRSWANWDLGNLLLVLILLALLGSLEQVEPHHRFIINRNDPAINYPLVKETVPVWMLMMLVEVLPISIIVLIYVMQRKIASAKRELYYVLFGFVYSMLLTLLLTSFMKKVSGRPRPNFVSLAQYGADGSFGGSAHDVSNAFQSFPSGHTSTAFAGLGFLGLYLFRLCFPTNYSTREAGQKLHVNQGYKTVMCIMPFVLATWIGLTRIVDYWHNFDDVAIGAFLGLSIASLTFQLHVNWWWSSLHDSDESVFHRSDNAILDPSECGCSNGTPTGAISGVRRNSGPSIVPVFTGAVVSPSGRRSATAAVQDKEEDMDAPLLGVV